MEPDTLRRRNFFVAAIYGLWSLMGAALVLPAGAYLLLSPTTRRKDDWTDIADVARLPLNEPEEVVFRRNRKDGWKVTSEKTSAWVLKQSESEVVAFAPQCTHLGCAYHWDAQKRHFLCPCHSSTFGQDGAVLTGPAPRALDRYETRIAQGKLYVGLIRKSGES